MVYKAIYLSLIICFLIVQGKDFGALKIGFRSGNKSKEVKEVYISFVNLIAASFDALPTHSAMSE